MFSFLRKKESRPDLSAVLALDDTAFVRVVLNSTTIGPPGAWLMTAVGYENLGPMLSASQYFADRNRDINLPKTLDSFIRFILNSIDKHSGDEIASRRLMWFFQAALIKRATERGIDQTDLKNTIAEIWICLAKGCGLLPTALAENQLWSASEKEWFSHVTDGNAGISYCLNHMMPKALRKHPSVQAFADSENVFLNVFF